MELFVLGAGFSRSFVQQAPLLTKFLAGYERLLDENEFVAVKRFLDQCRFNAFTANIETVMTLAEQYDREASQQLKLLMVRVLYEAFESQMEGDISFRFRVNHGETLIKFAKHLLQRSPLAPVITFNYDVLLENVLELEQEGPPVFHSGRCYGFHANTWRRNGGIRWQVEKEHKKHLLVLKLHGSANWRVPTDLRYAHRIVIISAHEHSLYKHHMAEKYVADAMQTLPLIVPPVLDKTSYLGHCALAQVWARAANLIQKARRIVFVGYSFPVTDYGAEYLFRVNYSPTCHVDVIDIGGCAGHQQRLSERYENIFGKSVKFHWGDAATELEKLMDL